MQAGTHTCDAASANDNVDDYLDGLLADLPLDFGDVPATPAVTNLDGTPCEPDPAPAPLARIPQKDSARPRASFARDRRNLHILRDFAPDLRTRKASRPDAPLVADTPSSPTPSRITEKRRKADKNDTRKAPTWSRTTEIIRGHTFVRTVSTRGGGLAWTLNLGGKVAQAANDNPKGLKERVHDRLFKALKASPLGARDFVFGIETTKDGRWHCHGVLDATEHEGDQVEEVLRKAGGTWNSVHHRDKQAHARTVIWGPDGWARYIMKGMARTKRLLGIKSVLSVTRGCRQRAEELWEASRRDPQEIDLDLDPGLHLELDPEIGQEACQRAAATAKPEAASSPSKPICEPVKLTPTRVSMPINGLVLPDPTGQSQLTATARSRGPPDRGGPIRMCQIARQDGISRNRRSAKHLERQALAVPGTLSSRGFLPRIDCQPAH